MGQDTVNRNWRARELRPLRDKKGRILLGAQFFPFCTLHPTPVGLVAVGAPISRPLKKGSPV